MGGLEVELTGLEVELAGLEVELAEDDMPGINGLYLPVMAGPEYDRPVGSYISQSARSTKTAS